MCSMLTWFAGRMWMGSLRTQWMTWLPRGTPASFWTPWTWAPWCPRSRATSTGMSWSTRWDRTLPTLPALQGCSEVITVLTALQGCSEVITAFTANCLLTETDMLSCKDMLLILMPLLNVLHCRNFIHSIILYEL